LNVPLPSQLCEPVYADGVRAIIFPIRPFSTPVKNVVGANIQQTGADFRTSSRHIPRPQGIDLLSLRRVRFAAIDVSKGSEMQNQFRPQFAEGALNRGFLPDVKILLIDSANLVFRLEAREQHRPQHPLCARNENAH
jgi:hypothetical protein